MALRNLTAPALEPVSVAQARLHLREVFASTDLDAAISQGIKAAREQAENDTRRAFITQTWRLSLDAFPRPDYAVSSASWYGPQWGNQPGPLQVLAITGVTGYEIYLPLPPLKTLDSIKYIDSNGQQQTMTLPGDVILDADSEPARIMPAYGTTWPATRQQPNAVTIDFTCGYGDTPASVPACVGQWMLTLLGSMTENRELEILAGRGVIQHFPFTDRLLDPLRIRRY